METAKDYREEADRLQGVPAKVGQIVKAALGEDARILFIVQGSHGGHLFTNDNTANDPDAMIALLNGIIQRIEEGRGEHRRIGPQQ
jgi:hypothetical protein